MCRGSTARRPASRSRSTGRSFLADAEESSAYEWGVKSILLDNTLTLNFDVFLTEIKNYQQSVQVFDEYTTALRNDRNPLLHASTGNAPKVEVKGVEVDGVYARAGQLTTLRFAGTFNDAKYKEFGVLGTGAGARQPDHAIPWDVPGEALAGAPKYTFNYRRGFSHPAVGRYELHSSANFGPAGQV